MFYIFSSLSVIYTGYYRHITWAEVEIYKKRKYNHLCPNLTACTFVQSDLQQVGWWGSRWFEELEKR